MNSPIYLVILQIVLLLLFSKAFCFAQGGDTPINPPTMLSQQLATTYQDDIDVKDYWVSEKLDGIRARWTGTALVTRNGNMIHAPLWFVKHFPAQVLDGELWLARNSFQQTASIVLRDTPSADWQKITFMLFDLPTHKGHFSQRNSAMQDLVAATNSPYLQVIPQFSLSNQQQLMQKLDALVEQNAEGLMLHHKNAYYQNGRSTQLLKLKKHQDAEAIVIAYIAGKGKYRNMLGSLLVELVDPTNKNNNPQFKIGSGFTDAERQQPPAIGSTITFKYYGLTTRGIPRFASFLRIKPTK
ncbi:DNA ligase [Paraglaciecola aquimarina]|uniref:DNA ligase n=1 Tax=Paraglaciecola aquimarina TaxID=1235557 RepID=A0ABU3T1M9_9ALTE|nr:DNA ligase [Paraglaciecola aquimarina]MDU0356185.1 DNA ligase [Paraglaciecola aquimarina]